MKSGIESKILEKSRTSRHSNVRAWREELANITDTIFILSEASSRRSLRIERALSGGRGYDLNRHIRLLRQRKIVGKK